MLNKMGEIGNSYLITIPCSGASLMHGVHADFNPLVLMTATPKARLVLAVFDR
jgi:hypothetical protein